MSSDELLVLEYLKRFSNAFTNASQICQEASTPRRYKTEPEWARPALQTLQGHGYLESDNLGQYRVASALLTKYLEHFRAAQRGGPSCIAVDKRIMKMAPEDDEKTFDDLLREALASNPKDNAA